MRPSAKYNNNNMYELENEIIIHDGIHDDISRSFRLNYWEWFVDEGITTTITKGIFLIAAKNEKTNSRRRKEFNISFIHDWKYFDWHWLIYKGHKISWFFLLS